MLPETPPPALDTAIGLIARCLRGDAAAVAHFQAEYGPGIYAYPQRRTRRRDAQEDACGDFYLYAFERAQIFRRLRGYEGRAPLKAYLYGWVLPDLYLGWRRRSKLTVPMESLPRARPAAPHEAARELDIAAPPPPSADNATALLRARLRHASASVAITMKLLCAADYDFSSEEVTQLAAESGRSLAQVHECIADLRTVISQREQKQHGFDEHLDRIYATLLRAEHRLRLCDAELAVVTEDSGTRTRLLALREMLQGLVRKRRCQQDVTLQNCRRTQTLAPFRLIAETMGCSTGVVGARVARFRKHAQRGACE